MRLRTGLFFLATAAAAPLLVFSLAAVAFAISQDRDSFVATAQARNRAVLAAVDSELLGTVYVLRSLAGGASLRNDDLASFWRDASAVLGTQPSWQNVVLQRSDGAQLVNARIPFGQELPQKAFDLASLEQVTSTGKPAFANLSFAPLLGNEPGIAVRVPVVKNGAASYVLTAVLSPRSFQRMLEGQSMPRDWVSGLVGTDGRIIARVPIVEAGSSASSDYLARIRSAKDGWYRGKTIEGSDTFTAFSRSDLTGWTIGYAMPSHVILGSFMRTITLMAAGIALSLLAAIAIALWLSRRISRPMSELADSAKSLGTPTPWRPVRSGFEEVARLSQALAKTAATIEQRDQEIERSQEVLRRQAAALTGADANRATFLALLSHELRNFLAPLKAGLTLLSRSPDLAIADRTRAMMRSQIDTMARLVEDLVDVGRIDRGELEMRLQRVDMADVVGTAVSVAGPSIEAKRQSLVADIEPDRFFVIGDAVRLGQVLANLLTNASKYTPEQGRVELSMREEVNRLAIAVTDSGAGFDDSERERLFEMFFRSDHTRQHHEAGLGIGLTIAKAIVEAHGGSISASSDGAGLGATFTVNLPLDSDRAPST